jgi:hypothetical protein
MSDVQSNMIDYKGTPLTAVTVWSNEDFMKNLAHFWNNIIQHPKVTTQITLYIQADKKAGLESTVINFDLQDGILSYAVLKGATPDKNRKGVRLGGEAKHWAKVFAKGDLKAVKMEFGPDFGLDEIPALHLLLHSAMGIAKDYNYMSPKDIDKNVKSTRL